MHLSLFFFLVIKNNLRCERLSSVSNKINLIIKKMSKTGGSKLNRLDLIWTSSSLNNLSFCNSCVPQFGPVQSLEERVCIYILKQGIMPCQLVVT